MLSPSLKHEKWQIEEKNKSIQILIWKDDREWGMGRDSEWTFLARF